MSGHVILFQRDELIRKLTSIRCHIQYETNICVRTRINLRLSVIQTLNEYDVADPAHDAF